MSELLFAMAFLTASYSAFESVLGFLPWWVAGVALAMSTVAVVWSNGLCLHSPEGGLGLMGDAYRCKKCGLDRYEEHFPYLFLYRWLGRVKNGGDA